jgi:hypothetical protein
MTKKIIIFWLTVTTVSGLCFSQKDYRPGYIITHSFDTIHGLINLRSNYQNCRSCEFKAESNSEPKTFLPHELYGYRIENSKFYISREINLNNEKQFVFLEYLLDGIVDLFYLKELRSDDFFIEKQGVLYQLSNEMKQVIINNNIYEKNSNQYVGVLNDLFRDSPETLNEIKNTPFSYKPLIAITKDYHNSICKDQECIDYTKSTKMKIWLEPNVGTSFSWMGYKTSKDYAFNFRPYGGINIRFIPFRSHYVWNFITGITLSSNDFSGDFLNSLYDGTFHIWTKYTIMSIPLTVEYNFPGKKIQPFLSLSYNNNFLINSDYEIYYVLTHGSSPYPSRFRTYQLGLAFDFGLRYSLNKSTYVYLKNEIEFRKSALSARNALDYHRIFSEMINFGFGFSIN